jgi:antirestriction protein
MTTPDFRIYVAPCTDSTGGHWLDPLDSDYDAAVAKISQDGQIEIFAPDHEGFAGIRSDSVFELEDIAQRASKTHEPDAFIAYMAHTGCDAEQAEEQFDDAYSGKWSDEEEFAADLAEQTMEIPKRLWPYFNAEAFARDLFIGDYFSTPADNGGIYVFRNV